MGKPTIRHVIFIVIKSVSRAQTFCRKRHALHCNAFALWNVIRAELSKGEGVFSGVVPAKNPQPIELESKFDTTDESIKPRETMIPCMMAKSETAFRVFLLS
jgi:hypothetical protein